MAINLNYVAPALRTKLAAAAPATPAPTAMSGTPFNLSPGTYKQNSTGNNFNFSGGTAYQPQSATRPALTSPNAAFLPTGGSSPLGSAANDFRQNRSPTSPLQPLGTTDQTNPGYGEQALNYTQNRLLEDPFQGYQQNLANQAAQPSAGQNYMDQNLGSLNGPGSGEQYWQGVQGQFQDPFAGEQYTRNATQNFSPTGAAGAFNDQAQGQYGQFTGFTGPGNTQGQYGATQASFGALPTPDSADPFYDRAIQLGTQAYNQGAAGRGVYGSSEALSGVGNVITDLNAKRAQTAFDNSMGIAQENRMRQQLLGEQANMADTQALGAQNSNISGLNALGTAANNADSAESRRYESTTQAMNNADKTSLDRLTSGADIANMSDANRRGDYTASMGAAANAANTDTSRLTAASGIASTGSNNDLARLNAFEATAQGAEGQRQTRAQSQLDAVMKRDSKMADLISGAQKALMDGDQQAFEDKFNTEIAPALQAAGYSQQEIDNLRDAAMRGASRL